MGGGRGWGCQGLNPTKERSLKAGEVAHVALPALVQSRPCPWNCHYEFRLFQNPAADCSKGSQLLSGNSSGRSPLNTKKLRCNQLGWNSGKCWLWSLRKREHVSGQKEANLPAPPVLLPPVRRGQIRFPRPTINGRRRRPPAGGAARPYGRARDPAACGQECSVIATSSCSLAPASNLSVVVSKAKHEPGFSIMVAILACNFITRTKSTSEMP